MNKKWVITENKCLIQQELPLGFANFRYLNVNKLEEKHRNHLLERLRSDESYSNLVELLKSDTKNNIYDYAITRSSLSAKKRDVIITEIFDISRELLKSGSRFNVEGSQYFFNTINKIIKSSKSKDSNTMIELTKAIGQGVGQALAESYSEKKDLKLLTDIIALMKSEIENEHVIKQTIYSLINCYNEEANDNTFINFNTLKEISENSDIKNILTQMKNESLIYDDIQIYINVMNNIDTEKATVLQGSLNNYLIKPTMENLSILIDTLKKPSCSKTGPQYFNRFFNRPKESGKKLSEKMEAIMQKKTCSYTVSVRH